MEGNDMTEVNRRNMMGAAGATLALTACGQTGKSSDANSMPDISTCITSLLKRDAVILGTGPSNDVGPVPDGNGRKKPKAYKGSGFSPAHDYLAYLKFEGGVLKIGTAYFENANKKTDKARAAFQFSLMSGTGSWDSTALAASDSFDQFGFGDQACLYFFVDNGDDVKFDPINLIIMSFFKATDTVKSSKTQLYPNNAFQNPEILMIGDKSILSVENWYATKDGDVIQKPSASGTPAANKAEFSMNIHLLMKYRSQAHLPIVIDPDGTNGIKKP
jgi:hypothetical protein